jgi:hypothetical protein
VKTTIDRPDALVREMKLRAIHEGKKFKDAVAETLRAGLMAGGSRRNGKSSRQQRVAVKRDRKTGLPVIQCPVDAPARRMTTAQLIQLEEQTQTREDLERLGLSI